MRGSQFDLLREPEIVVLAAGHGGDDPGNVWGGHREADETIVLTDLITGNLRAKGLRVEVVPHGEALGGAIRYVNSRFAFGQAWAVDVHRDSADSITPGSADANGRCGVYYGNSEQSRLIGQFIRRVFLREGAHPTSWARIHTDSPRRRLGWIVHTNPVAHLLELGFLQGRRSREHMEWLARLASIAVYEAFTGEGFDSDSQPASPSSLMERLARAYAAADLGGLFGELGIDNVNPAHHDYLKTASLAQWTLESGWATSRLATQHFNFGGLKWRDEMQGYATPIEYDAHDGRDLYCRFASIEEFVKGYWRFLTRAPYRGWNEFTFSPRAFITFIFRSGYAASESYDADVGALFTSAERLLAEARRQ